MRLSNAESSDTFTAKQGFFDRTLALHTERLEVSCRVRGEALIEPLRIIRTESVHDSATSLQPGHAIFEELPIIGSVAKSVTAPLRQYQAAFAVEREHPSP